MLQHIFSQARYEGRGAIFLRLWLLFGLLGLALPLRAQPLVLVADPQPHVDVAIKSTTVHLRVSLEIEGALVLNAMPAARARLKAFPLIGTRTVQDRLLPGGQVTARGNAYAVRINSGPKERHLVVWFDKPVDDAAEGIVGVHDLNADEIIVRQPRAPQGGSDYVLPLDSSRHAYAKTTIAGVPVTILLDLAAPYTVMNARAAAALEDAQLVARTGEVDLYRPFPGIALPVERMMVLPNASLLGVPLRMPAARITEERAKQLDARAQAGTSTPNDQDDAIVITSEKGSRWRRKEPWVRLGRDVLGQCAQIILNKRTKAWQLTCDFNAPARNGGE